MIIEVVKEFSFDAAHFLPGHPGKCKECHGHRWVLQVGVQGGINPETGMVIDFGDIKKVVEQYIISELDHKFLNELEPRLAFPTEQPTAEKIIKWIVTILTKRIFFEGFLTTREVKLSLVRLYESPTSCAEWRPHGNAES